MAFFIKISLSLISCLVSLLVTLQMADAFENSRGEVASSAHQGAVKLPHKHATNQVQTTAFRRPPSGPNPEGNFEVNAASQDVGKHELHTTAVRSPPSGPNPEGNFEVNAAQDVGKRGGKVQNMDAASVTKKKLTGAFEGNAASKYVGMHDTHHLQTTAVRRPPSGPNPEGNFEVSAASQDVGKRGAKVQNVDAASLTKKDLTGSTQG